MTYTMFAQWLGLVSVILSLGVLFNLEYAHNIAKRMVDTEVSYLTTGVLPIALGTLILLNADCFDFCWHLVISIFASILLIAGMYRVMFVKHWQRFIANHVDYLPFLICLFGLMLGLILIYAGFIAPLITPNIN